MYIFRLPAEYQVELTNICVGMIHTADSKSSWIWSKILPMLISMLIIQNTVNFNGKSHTGAGFKTEIINAICLVRWNSDMIISLASMFG